MPKEHKKIKVAVVTIPLERYKSLDEGYNEYFRKGSLSKQRAALIKHIKASAKQFNSKIEVTDAGDLTHEMHIAPRGILALHGKLAFDRIGERTVHDLGAKIEKLKKEHDLVITLGHSHTGAVFMYTGKGNIARFDAHTDMYGDYHSKAFTFANYALQAISHGFKQKNSIRNYGYSSPNKKDWHSIPNRPIDAETFDIDLDVFERDKYEMQNEFDTGIADIPDVGKHVLNSKKIKALGFFEYRPHQDKKGIGLRTIKALSLAAIKSIDRRKTKATSRSARSGRKPLKA